MSIFREIPPIAGWPIYTRDILSLLKAANRRCSLDDDFKNYLQVEYAKITNSGTAAFYFILEALKGLSGKKTVIIPSYICPFLPLAIKRAGLNTQVCDITGRNFDFNLSELDYLCSRNKDILAVVVTHLAGIALDLDAVESIVKKYGIFIIEDCAQSLGARYKDKLTGTIGDFSFFSLCRGKGLTIYEGGAAVANKKEFAKRLDDKINQLSRNDFLSEALKILELFGYGIFYRPQLFWFVFRLPQIFWNLQGRKFKAALEEFTQGFPIHRVSGLRKLIGHAGFYRLESQIKQQRQNAAYYIDRLKGAKGIELITEPAYCRANYPYLTLIFDDLIRRKKVLAGLGNSGRGISLIYGLAITDYDYLKHIVGRRDCKGGRYLAQRELTLSTSVFLTPQDLSFVVNTINAC